MRMDVRRDATVRIKTQIFLKCKFDFVAQRKILSVQFSNYSESPVNLQIQSGFMQAPEKIILRQMSHRIIF